MIHKLLTWWYGLSIFPREEILYTKDQKIYFDYRNNSINLNFDHPEVKAKIKAQLIEFEQFKVKETKNG